MRTPQTRHQIHTLTPGSDSLKYQAMVLADHPLAAMETYLRDAPEDKDKAIMVTPLDCPVTL